MLDKGPLIILGSTNNIKALQAVSARWLPSSFPALYTLPGFSAQIGRQKAVYPPPPILLTPTPWQPALRLGQLHSARNPLLSRRGQDFGKVKPSFSLQKGRGRLYWVKWDDWWKQAPQDGEGWKAGNKGPWESKGLLYLLTEVFSEKMGYIQGNSGLRGQQATNV